MRTTKWSKLGAAFLLLAGAVTGLAAGSLAFGQVFTDPAPPPKPRSSPQPKPKPRSRTQPADGQRSQRGPVAAPKPAVLSDPIGYCQVNADADVAGADYFGPPLPPWISVLLSSSQRGPASSGGTVALRWRCMDRRVMACATAPGSSDCEKASDDKVPNAEITQYCVGKRKGGVPFTVTGTTVAIWQCRNGAPAIAGYRPGIDKLGYLSENWKDVTDWAPSNLVGAVPRSVTGAWQAVLYGKGFLFKIPYDIRLTIKGGMANAEIGTVEYYANDLGGNLIQFCASTLVLRNIDVRQIGLEERVIQRGQDGRCPAGGQVSLQPGNNQLYLSWYQSGSTKPKMAGWVNHPSQ